MRDTETQIAFVERHRQPRETQRHRLPLKRDTDSQERHGDTDCLCRETQTAKRDTQTQTAIVERHRLP